MIALDFAAPEFRRNPFPVYERLRDLRLAAGGPWEPRAVLNLHGPASLPVEFDADARLCRESNRPGSA